MRGETNTLDLTFTETLCKTFQKITDFFDRLISKIRHYTFYILSDEISILKKELDEQLARECNDSQIRKLPLPKSPLQHSYIPKNDSEIEELSPQITVKVNLNEPNPTNNRICNIM